MQSVRSKCAQLVVAAVIAVSAAFVPVSSPPEAHATTDINHLFDLNQWTTVEKGIISKIFIYPFYYGVYTVGVTWQGKASTPLKVPTVGDVFYIHIWTETSNIQGSSYQMRALLPTGVQWYPPDASNDMLCGITNLNDVEIRLPGPGECVLPVVAGGLITFPKVSLGVNEKFHYWFPVKGTQAVNGGALQITSTQTVGPTTYNSMPNPTIANHTLWVLASNTTTTAPGAPTGLSATALDSSAQISFTAGSSGGAVISNYQYSLNGGASWTSLSPADGASPVTVRGLTNGSSYSIQLRAVNSVGVSGASAAVSVTPKGPPGAPTGLTASAGNGSATISFSPAAANGSAVTNYQYSLDMGANWTALSPADATSPVTVPGLSNGTQYNIVLRAVNAMGEGDASGAVSVTPVAPVATPAAPTGLGATPGNGSATVSFTPGAPGTSAISNYQYSLNGGAWTSFAPAATSSPVTVGGLANGTQYSVQLRAVSAAGPGAASSAVVVTPRTVPSAPIGLTGAPGDGSASISFAAGSTGGAAITNYEWTVNGGGTWTPLSPEDSTSPVVVPGLTNGVSYSVQLRAVNAAGAGAASAAVTVTPAPPATVPGAPTGLVAVARNGAATVSFAVGPNGGSAITNHQYSLNGGATWTAFSPAVTSGPVTINGLANGTTYTVSLRAVSAIGAGASSAGVAVKPFAPAAAPTRLVASPRNGAAVVSFLAGAANGAAITNYQYSLNGGAWRTVSPADATSPITVPGLSNGVLYGIRLRPVNGNGAGTASTSVSVRPSATAVVPGAPGLLTAKSGSTGRAAAVTFWPGSDGGAGITNYQYSLNGGAWRALSPADGASPVTIPALAPGTTYGIRLRAVNAKGVGAASASVSVTTFRPPAAPSGVSAVGGNGAATVSFTAGSNGGSAITNYQYSLNGGAWVSLSPADNASPVRVPSLVNGTAYGVRIRAVNPVGAGAASASVSVTPRSAPAAPTGLVATPGNSTASISFTSGANGGAAITNHQYSLDGGTTWTALSPADATSPVTVPGLVNGAIHNIQLRAVNAAGVGAASALVYVTPRTVPSTPTAFDLYPGISGAWAYFQVAYDGGAPITGYEFTVDSGATWKPIVGTASPLAITGLTNGATYNLQIRARNAAGASAATAAKTVTPRGTPGAPTSLSATPGDSSATITFTVPVSTGGAPIAAYWYSLNGVDWFGTDPNDQGVVGTTGHITIRNLTNGTPYSIRLRAVNSAGGGVASTAVAVTPRGLPSMPTSLSAVANDGSATISFTAPASDGGFPITNYQYSLDGVNFVSFSPADTISPVTVPGLTNGTTYNIYLRAVTTVGAGAESNIPANVKPYGVPGTPSSVGTQTVFEFLNGGFTGERLLQVFWTAPSDGGSAIVSYTARAYSASVGGTLLMSCTAGAFDTSCTTTDVLVSGTTYWIEVVATNARGDSPPSARIQFFG